MMSSLSGLQTLGSGGPSHGAEAASECVDSRVAAWKWLGPLQVHRRWRGGSGALRALTAGPVETRAGLGGSSQVRGPEAAEEGY